MWGGGLGAACRTCTPSHASRPPLPSPSFFTQALTLSQTAGATALDAAAAALASLAPGADAHRRHPAVARLLRQSPSPQLAAYVECKGWRSRGSALTADAVSDAVAECAAGVADADAAAVAADALLAAVQRRCDEAAGGDDADTSLLTSVAAVAAVADAAATTADVRRRVAAWLAVDVDADDVAGVALAWRLTPCVAEEDVQAALRVERERR